MKTTLAKAAALGVIFGLAVSAIWDRAMASADDRPDCPAELEQLGGGAEVEQICDPETGVVTREGWFLNGQPHREAGPALIDRDADTGVVTREGWFLNGKLHREDGPAGIERDAGTGVVVSEGWFLNGKLHREDGPAIISSDADMGVVTREEWWLNGVPSTPPPARAPSMPHP